MSENKNIFDTILQTPGSLASDAFSSLYNTAENERGVTGDVARKIVSGLNKAGEEGGAAEKLSMPYKEYSAKPLSAILLTIKDAGRNGKSLGETWNTAWKQAAYVSPGQALYGAASRAPIWNLTGKPLAVDKLNWANEGEVKRFFEADNTSAERISGAIDVAANIFLDPLVFLGKAAKLGKAATFGMRGVERKGVLRLTGNNQAKLINDLEDARAGKQNSASVVVRSIMDNMDDFATIEALPIVARSTDPTAVGRMLMAAAKSGGEDSVIDVLRVSIGDESVLPKLEAKNAELVERINGIRKQRTAVNNQIKKLNDRIDALEERPHMSRRQLDEYMKVKEDLVAAKAKKQAIKGKMKKTTAQSDVILKSTSDEENIFGRVGRELAWSRSRFHEERRRAFGEWHGKGWQEVTRAEDDPLSAYLSEKALGYAARGAKIISSYVSPSYKLREVPAGSVTIAGDVGNDSVREFRARLTQAAKESKMDSKLQKQFYTRYAALSTDSERFQFLEKFEHFSLMRQIRNKFDDLGLDFKSLNQGQRETLLATVSKMAEDATNSKYSFLNKLINEQNYVYVDDFSGEPVILQDLKNHVESLAKRLAKQDNREDWDSYVTRAGKIISETPQLRTQIPNLHYGVDFTQFQKLIDDNEYMIHGIAKAIKSDANIKKNDILQVLNAAKIGAPKPSVIEIGRNARDFSLIPMYEAYQNYMWKPMTLLSFRYTSRNLLESQSRIHASIADMTGYYGYSLTSLVRGLFDPSAVTQPTKSFGGRFISRIKREGLISGRGGARGVINELQAELDANNVLTAKKFGVTKGDDGKKIFEKVNDRYHRESEYFLQKANDTLAASIYYTYDHFKSFKGFRGSAENKVITDKIYEIGTNIFNAGGKKNVSHEMLRRLSRGDIDGAHRIAMSTKNPEIIFNTLEFISRRAISAQKEINALVKSSDMRYKPLFSSKVQFANELLDTIKNNADVTKMAFDSNNRIRLMEAYNEALTVSMVPPKKKYAYSQGRTKFGKGYSIAAPYADEMRRATASSAASTTRSVLGAHRQTLAKLTDGPTKQDIIQVTDDKWSAAHAEFIQNIVYGDEVAKMIIDMSVAGQTPAQIRSFLKNKWLKSQKSVSWRREKRIDLMETRKKLTDAQYEDFIDSAYDLVSTYLPLKGPNGEDFRFLRENLVNGSFSDVDSAKIPMGYRYPVYGNATIPDKSFKNVYKNVVNNMFHMLATMPEDTFARHPFYNAVYRAEGERIAKQLQAKGISGEAFTAKYEKMVTSAAHAAARKAVIDRLYTIERNTNMAEAMRFLSPFYMAQQNSTRFWLGTTLRNPDVAYRLVASYTLPYRLGYVQNRDDNYEHVNQIGHPWNTKGMVLVYDYPQWMKNKLFHGENYKREIPLSGFDVMFQGQRPGVPQIGSPIAVLTLGQIMRSVKGKSYDPQNFLDKYGINTDDVIKEIQPYYEASRGKSIVGNVVSSGFTGSVFIQKSMIALGGMSGTFNSATDGQQFADRVDVILSDKLVKLAEQDIPITAKLITQLREESVALATKSFWAEAITAGGPTVSTQRFRTETQVGRQAELRKYTSRYGYDLGVSKFTESLDTQGAGQTQYVVSLLTDSNVDNRFGLNSSSATLNGIYANEPLIANADKMAADKHIIGTLLNQGDFTKDYNEVVSDIYYNINVNGKPLKFRSEDRFGGEEDAQIRAGNRDYYKRIELLEQQARLLGYSSGSNDYKEKIQPLKDAAEAEVSAKYPIWAERQVTLRVNRVEKNLAAAQMIITDPNFKNTVGAKNSMAPAVREYLKARQSLIEELDRARAASGRKTIGAKANAYVEELRDNVVAEIDRAYPGFQRVFDIYFSGDKLNDISIYVD